MKHGRRHALILVALFTPICGLFRQEPTPTPQPVQAEFGDAPDPTFPSLLASDGARALDTSQFWLGSAVNTEPEAQTVDRDSFDDGLVEILVADVVRVTFEATRSEDSQSGVVYFNLLADSNGDGRWGSFEGPSGPVQEWVVVNQSLRLEPGARQRIEAQFPLAGGNLEAWIRATLTDSPIEAEEWEGTGQFESGEIEDYRIGPQDVWSIECDPDPLVIDHGSGGAINLVIRGAAAPDTMEVVSVTGSPGLLGDPNGAQLDVDPDSAAGQVAFGQIAVNSPAWAVHGFPGLTLGVTYGIEVKVEGPEGVKSVNCTVIVNHAAPEDAPPAIITDQGYHITFAGPLRAQSGGTLQATFHVTDSGGQPATGELSATLGDPPTDPNASHARSDLDAEGFVTLELEVNWPAGVTRLYCSFGGQVFEVAEITIAP